MNSKMFFKSFSFLFLQAASFMLGFRSTIGLSFFGNSIFLKFVTYLIWGTVLFVCFLDTYIVSDFIRIVFLFVIGWLVAKGCGVTSVLYNFMFLVAVKNHDLEKIIEMNFWGILFAFLFVVFSSQIGIIETRVMDGGNSLGFINPNCVSNISTALLINYSLRKYNKIQLYNVVIISFVAFLIYFVCKSRTGLLLDLILVFALFLFKTIKETRMLFQKLLFFFCGLALFMGLAGVFLCNIVPFFTKLNQILSGRYAQAQVLLIKYGIHPFGSFIEELDEVGRQQLIESQGASNVPFCDNGYARLLIQYGIVYLIFYIFAFWKTIGLYRKQNKFNYLLPFLLVLFATISETVWLSVNYCIFYLCLSKWIFRKKVCSMQHNNLRLFLNLHKSDEGTNI